MRLPLTAVATSDHWVAIKNTYAVSDTNTISVEEALRYMASQSTIPEPNRLRGVLSAANTDSDVREFITSYLNPEQWEQIALEDKLKNELIHHTTQWNDGDFTCLQVANTLVSALCKPVSIMSIRGAIYKLSWVHGSGRPRAEQARYVYTNNDELMFTKLGRIVFINYILGNQGASVWQPPMQE